MKIIITSIFLSTLSITQLFGQTKPESLASTEDIDKVSNRLNVSVGSVDIDKFDVFQFPEGSIVSKNKYGEFDVWELTTIETAETMTAVYSPKNAMGKGAMNPDSVVTTERYLPSNFAKAGIDEGIAYVRYNLDGGAISKGDFITVSGIPGVGMKATEDCFVIGVALEDKVTATDMGLLKMRVLVRYEKF